MHGGLQWLPAGMRMSSSQLPPFFPEKLGWLAVL
jgi:hypothetical protein